MRTLVPNRDRPDGELAVEDGCKRSQMTVEGKTKTPSDLLSG